MKSRNKKIGIFVSMLFLSGVFFPMVSAGGPTGDFHYSVTDLGNNELLVDDDVTDDKPPIIITIDNLPLPPGIELGTSLDGPTPPTPPQDDDDFWGWFIFEVIERVFRTWYYYEFGTPM